MAKEIGKNIKKVAEMLDGSYGQRKITVGQYQPTEEVRKVGDRWTDSDGKVILEPEREPEGTILTTEGLGG